MPEIDKRCSDRISRIPIVLVTFLNINLYLVFNVDVDYMFYENSLIVIGG